MVKSEEQLPLDWTENFKVEKNGQRTKYYMNAKTGQKFFYKEDLLRYVEMKKTQLHEPHSPHGHGKTHAEHSSSKLVAKENNHENSSDRRHSENRSSELVPKDNNKKSRGKRHSETNSSKLVARENNHENIHGKSFSENTSTKPVAKENNRPEWLPDGWVVELKTRKSGSTVGRQDKVYIEPLTGCKFFSRPEVLRYLESVKNGNSECEREITRTETSKYEDAPKVSTKSERDAEASNYEVAEKVSTKSERETTERDTETSNYEGAEKISTKSDREATERDTETSNYEGAKKVSTKRKRKTTERVVVERSTVDDLPPGWIKETKIRKTANKIRKDPYYTDPVSGYVFISKKDVFRYLETGEISRYAFKPGKGGTDDSEKPSPLACAESQKLEHAATKRQLFPVFESSDVCSPGGSRAQVLKRKEVSAEIGLAAEISPYQTGKMAIDDKGAETNEVSGLSGSGLPKLRGRKRNQGKMLYADNGSASTPVIDSLQGQRVVQGHVECSNRKTPNDMTKSLKKKRLNFPLRSSKRLAGLEPEPVSNRMTDVTIPSGETSNKLKCSGINALPGEQLQKFKSAETIDDKSEQHISLFFGDSLIDPCLESAFKALMGELPVNSKPDNELVSNPAAKSMRTAEGEKSSSRKTRTSSMQSKNKQELNLTRRSSNRLAGVEPQMVVDCKSLERAPKNLSTELCKSKGILAAGLTSNGLLDEVSQQHKTGPVLGLPNRASEVLGLAKHVSSDFSIPSGGELSNIIKSSGNLAITGGQSAEANGKKLEPHVSFGDSHLHPCKAVMGETLVDSVLAKDPTSSAAADILPDEKLWEAKIPKSSNKKTQKNSTKSKKNQELSLPRRSSKRLAGLEPELASDSVAGEQACGNVLMESCKNEAPTCEKTDPCGQAEVTFQQVDAGHETMLTQHDCTDMITLLFEGSPEQSSKPLEAQIDSEEQPQKLEEEPEEQPQKLGNEKPEEQPHNVEIENPEGLQKFENERMDNENPDSQILFPFGDSWSDPCLEFAFKTLTGAIPVDENLAIQDYLQHQIDPSNSQKNDNSAVSNFAPIHSFQTDASHPFDAPAMLLAPVPSQQQLPENPFLPPGNVSMPSSSSIASQQRCLDGKNELQGKNNP